MSNAGICHASIDAIDAAAAWLVSAPVEERIRRPIIPTIRERFGLDVASAIEACRAADRLRREAHHAGG